MYIQITDEGFEHLRKTVGTDYIKACILNKLIVIEGQPWYRLQCHEVFHLLPATNGTRSLFSSNVMFDEDSLI